MRLYLAWIMGQQNNRTRVISFRVSLTEYAELGKVAKAAGARNVSEFCRDRMRLEAVASEDRRLLQEIGRKVDDLLSR